MKFFCKFFVLSLILQGLASPTEAMLLTSPLEITEEEVEKRAQGLSLGMNWETTDKENGHRSTIAFEQKEGKTVMRIQFEKGFSEMLAPFESSFTLSTPKGNKVWTFIYGDSEPVVPASSTEVPLSLEEAMGIVHAPRILEKQTPQIVTLPEITKLIRDKRCVFYTGAGISAGVVPTMPQLMKSLQLESIQEKGKEEFINVLQGALHDSASFIQPMEGFYKACLYGKPTLAHNAIRDIVQQKDWGVLTKTLISCINGLA